MNDLLEQYNANKAQIRALENDNLSILCKVVERFFASSKRSFLLRNVAINYVVLSTDSMELNNMIWQFKKDINSFDFMNGIVIHLDNNGTKICFKNTKLAKEFIKNHNIDLIKNDFGMNIVQLDHVINNYLNLFEYLKI